MGYFKNPEHEPIRVRKLNSLEARLPLKPDAAQFGAVRYDPGNPVETSTQLQAFYDFFQNEQNCRLYIGDASGEWLINKTIYADYGRTGEPNVDRRFKAPTLRIARLPDLAVPNVPLDYALEITGYRMQWEGVTGIHTVGTAQAGQVDYYNRPLTRGVHIRGFASSIMGPIYVDDCRRDGVHFVGQEAGFTLRSIAHSGGNSIGAQVGLVYGRFCGGSENAGASYGPGLVTVTGRTHGRNSGGGWYDGTELFDTTVGGYASSFYQRSELALSSAADIEIMDQVWGRVELTPAIYGTVAVVDNGDGTYNIVWTASDPTAFNGGAGKGLAVGDMYPTFQGGPNVGQQFRIVSFSGTSNRTIRVAPDNQLYPTLTAHAATADAAHKQYGARRLFWVTHKAGDTIRVYPWFADRINSQLHIVHGAAFRIEGDDTANVKVAGAIGLLCGHNLWTSGNFAAKYETILGESCQVGIRIGRTCTADLHPGLNIAHGHLEGNAFDIASGTYLTQGTINLESLFDLRNCVAGAAAASGFNNNEEYFHRTLGTLLKLTHLGRSIQYEDPSTLTISNAERSRVKNINETSPAIRAEYDWLEDQTFANHHWAELWWTSLTGDASAGTLTLNMDPTLALLGWVFSGAGAGATTYAIAAPANPVLLKLQFLASQKKISIIRINGA